MATPVFLDIALTSNSERDEIGMPVVRMPLGHLPGVDGAFANFAGMGERHIKGSGYLQAGGSDGDDAQQALKTMLRDRQGGAIGKMGTYLSTDNTAYDNSLLISYEQAGPVEMQYTAGAASPYTARIPVKYTILQVLPKL